MATGVPYICEIKLGTAGRAYGTVMVDRSSKTGTCTRTLYCAELSTGTLSVTVTIAPLNRPEPERDRDHLQLRRLPVDHPRAQLDLRLPGASITTNLTIA